MLDSPLSFNAYQDKATSYDMGCMKGDPIFYKSLGLVGEAGEFAEQVKKFYRDVIGPMTPVIREKMLKELGDTLWYISALAKELNTTLENVAKMNLEKIEDRAKRNVMRGSGNDR